MNNITIRQRAAAKAFSEFWKSKGYEKGESQMFWTSLLKDVFLVEHPELFISFEEQVHIDTTSFIDGHIKETKVLIEQKSITKNLTSAIRQSDGSYLTPFQQVMKYVVGLPLSEHPRWVVTCNFKEFFVYDMENPMGEPQIIKLENLEKEYYRLSFLVDNANAHLQKEKEVSMKAGEIIGKIYDELIKQYQNPDSEEAKRSLNVLCVRLVFCLYAEDAGIFGAHSQFHDYLAQFDAGQGQMREALIKLFEVLDTPEEKRDPYMSEALKAFPYCNGGLFSDKNIEIPRFNDRIAKLLLQHASDDFDWSAISPTIFGGVFESTLNPETRRKGGMHYTSIENIHKAIDPLFFNDLRQEFKRLKRISNKEKRKKELFAFQEYLASLVFLDPACGSGNFLTESYLSLRRLENEIIKELYDIRQIKFEGDFSVIKVSIHQFYGIEINDFAVDVATTAMWIAESQMMQETEKITGCDIKMLPLKNYRNIKKGNALRENWTIWPDEDSYPEIYAKETNLYVIPEATAPTASEQDFIYDGINLHTEKLNINPKTKPLRQIDFDYIIGNPPFIGARMMNTEQKEEMIHLFGKQWRNVGNMDYVCGWYYKAAQLAIQNKHLHAALVSTNSITQGEQVANLWKPLMQDLGVHINFAHRTFRWDSESTLKAHVHCVIIGFSCDDNSHPKALFDAEGNMREVSNINGYLMDMPDFFVESRNSPICDVPQIGIGNKPIDDGNYLFTENEMFAFIKKEPKSEKYFKKWIGADEFINRWFRYCLWLGECTPNELRQMPECFKRVKAVRNFRLESKSAGTRKLADCPTRFHVENMPTNNYIVIPRVSSEHRQYVPIGFVSPDTFSSDSVHILTGSTLYHFGILTSNVHNAWLRAVGGRLKSDYRYSKDIVYNNFPWPEPIEWQKKKIEATANEILAARELYPDSSLADLYNDVTMPIKLRKAHQANDKAVKQAFGFNENITERQLVLELMKMHMDFAKKEKKTEE